MNTRPSTYTFFPLIVALSVTCLLVSYLTPYKIWQLGFLILPGGVVLFPLAYIFDDIIAEVYGYTYARQAIWLKWLCLTMLALSIALIVALPPASGHEAASQAFNVVFAHDMKAFLGYAMGLLVSDFANTILMAKWKVKAKGRYFSLRSIGAAAVGEAVFSLVCGFIVYMGVISFHEYINITLSVWSVKMVYGIIIAYPASLVVKRLKRIENSDPYDVHTNFSPFQLRGKPDKMQLSEKANYEPE